MKTNVRKTATSLTTGIFILLLAFINLSYGQDVVVSVRGLHDTKAVSLDSILILNENNGSVLKLGSLPQNVTDYLVNLSNGAVEIKSGITDLRGSESLSLKSNGNGFDLVADFEKPQKLTVSVYSIDGKQVSTKDMVIERGNNSYPFAIETNGIYIVRAYSGGFSKSFKLLHNRQGSEISPVIEVQPEKNILKSGTLGGFVYSTGDRIQVSVKKGNLSSMKWYGKPANGNQIIIALPKTGAIFDMKQTISSGAQINTISFSGVAFYSGCFYASSFYPPGKVADYFGFQYMRDNDPDESGHNTDFLTKAAYHTMNILNPAQLQMLIDLAVEQESLFNAYAYKRLVLIKAFHRYLENDMPTGTTTLNADSVKKVSKELYLIDGEISYGRAQKFAQVINSLTEAQRDSLYKLGALGMQVWTMPAKPTVQIPKGLNTWVMSNASELFSWFLRGVEAGVYFCPERQGTYFGGFYMKDAPAVGNPGYAIDPEATANKGAFMLTDVLTDVQSKEIKDIYKTVKPSLDSIVKVREKITVELRKALEGKVVDKSNIMLWSGQYGEFDGDYIYAMVAQFVKVGRTLSTEQKAEMVTLRDLADYPCKDGKVFLYSAEIDEPVIPNTDFLFK